MREWGAHLMKSDLRAATGVFKDRPFRPKLSLGVEERGLEAQLTET